MLKEALLRQRARYEPEKVLQVWLGDSRKMVRRVAMNELQRRVRVLMANRADDE